MYMGKKLLLAAAMAAIVSGSAFADDQGSGKIKFKGVVIDAPCSIAPDSVDKEVDLGEVTTAVINANKKSTPVPVDINLENCQLDDPADETDTPITKSGSDLYQRSDRCDGYQPDEQHLCKRCAERGRPSAG